MAVQFYRLCYILFSKIIKWQAQPCCFCFIEVFFTETLVLVKYSFLINGAKLIFGD